MLFSFKISNLPFVKGPVVTTHHSKNSTHILAICSIILMLYLTYIIFIEETVGRPKLTTCGKHDILMPLCKLYTTFIFTINIGQPHSPVSPSEDIQAS